MTEAEPVGTVERFLRQVLDLWKDWREDDSPEWHLWFRGEDEADYRNPLRPKLYRHLGVEWTENKLRDALHSDQELRLEFRRRAAQLVPGGRAPDPWDLYFLMQHYEVPTRLLDWTDGALVGLYFALRSRKSSDCRGDAAVYVLDPWWLNEKAFAGRTNVWTGVTLSDWPQVRKYLPKELSSGLLRAEIPLAIDPTHLSGRIAAQRSRFTIFGRDPDALVSIAGRRGSKLRRIRVIGQGIDRVRRELKICGISESTTFPDIEGLGRELERYWGELCPPKPAKP